MEITVTGTTFCLFTQVAAASISFLVFNYKRMQWTMLNDNTQKLQSRLANRKNFYVQWLYASSINTAIRATVQQMCGYNANKDSSKIPSGYSSMCKYIQMVPSSPCFNHTCPNRKWTYQIDKIRAEFRGEGMEKRKDFNNFMINLPVLFSK